MKNVLKCPESRSGKEFRCCQGYEKSVMNWTCQNIDDSGMHIVFLVSFLNTPYPAYSGTPKVGSSSLSVGEKNRMQSLWPGPQNLLRPENGSGSRSFLREHAHLPGCGSSAGILPKMPDGKSGDPGMVGRDALLHETVFLLCGAALPGLDSSGCGPRAASELEDGQGLGDAVHAGAAAEGWNSRAAGDWHRRSFGRQRSRLPHRGERFGEAPPHLVWGKRSFGGEYGSFLSVVGAQEEQKNPVGGHGHVEAFSELDPEKCAAGGHSF